MNINNDQAVKRQSLPELLSNLGQNLMTLGKNMTIKTPGASASSSGNKIFQLINFVCGGTVYAE